MSDTIKVAAEEETAVGAAFGALRLNSIARTLKDAAAVAAGVGAFTLDLEHGLDGGQPFAVALEAAMGRIRKPWVAEAVGLMLSNVYRGRAHGTLGKREAVLVLGALAGWVREHGCRLIEQVASLTLAEREEEAAILAREAARAAEIEY